MGIHHNNSRKSRTRSTRSSRSESESNNDTTTCDTAFAWGPNKKALLLSIIQLAVVIAVINLCLSQIQTVATVSSALFVSYDYSSLTSMVSSNSDDSKNGKSPYAYVYLSYGCEPHKEKASYRGYLANLLASAKLLRQFGAKADIVAIFKIHYSVSDQITRLPIHEEQMMEALGIDVRYLPRAASPESWQESDNFGINILNKVHILNMTEYERILYLDSDVMALTNMDYLFHLSHGENAIFKDNIIIPSRRLPLIGGFFLMRPNATAYQILIDKIDEKQRNDGFTRHFDEVRGWGHEFISDNWTANEGITGTRWNFYAACSDQGIFYYYPLYLQKSVTNILSRRIVNYGPGPNGTVRIEKEWTVRSIQESPLYNHSISHFSFERPKCNQVTKWLCVPPYSDHAHFYGDRKPWKNPIPTDLWDKNITLTAERLWWQMVAKLQEDGINSTALISSVSNEFEAQIKDGVFLEAGAR